MKSPQWLVIPVLVSFIGCGQPEQNVALPKVDDAGKQFVLASEPSGAVAVGEARQSVESEQSVTLVGLIGGSRDPFVDGVAAFTIVDQSVPFCAPDEGCPTPWDYCCKQDQVKDNIVTVKMVDESGGPIAKDARELLGVSELSQVTVQGMASRDEAGNLTVAATKIYIQPGE
ncbi:MAG: hypothetical protein AAFX06_26655 [Planctomycetota bacterium]